MEVDAVKTLADSLGQFTLTNFLDSSMVVEGATLVELPEKLVELGVGARCPDKVVPR